MNDKELKREIEEALAFEPSPHFVARVRQGLAGVKPGRPVGLLWNALAAGLVTTVILGGVAVYQPQTTTMAPPPVKDVLVAVAPAEIPTADEPQPVAAPTRSATRRRPEPEVLIDPRETEAFRDFIEDVHEQRIDTVKLEELFEVAERSRSMKIEPVPIAGLEPIVVPPLTPAVIEREKEGGSL